MIKKYIGLLQRIQVDRLVERHGKEFGSPAKAGPVSEPFALPCRDVIASLCGLVSVDQTIYGIESQRARQDCS